MRQLDGITTDGHESEQDLGAGDGEGSLKAQVSPRDPPKLNINQVD